MRPLAIRALVFGALSGRLVPLAIISLAMLAGLSAAGDRLVTVRYSDDTTDDAYLRADITPLASRVDGYVARVLVKDFERVHAGQLLVEIDPSDLKVALRAAEARLEAAHAAVETLQRRQEVQTANIRAASALLDASQAEFEHSQHEEKRQDRLARSGLTSGQEQDRAIYYERRLSAEVRRRAADRKQANVELGLLAAEERRALAVLREAEAAVDAARLQLGYTRIVAPADGMLGERGVRVGQLVRPGTPIVSLVEIDRIWVTANFKERQLQGVRPGNRAKVRVDTFAGVELQAKVEEVAPASGAQFSLLPPDNATGNFTKIVQRIPVKLTLEVPPELRGQLRPGMSTVVVIDHVAH